MLGRKKIITAYTEVKKTNLDSRLLNMVNKAMNTPDPERAARIKFLKEQVQSGTYKIDTEKVAQSMLKDLLKDLV
jgi:negative regulator of flagellin synthesis FlgM